MIATISDELHAAAHKIPNLGNGARIVARGKGALP